MQPHSDFDLLTDPWISVTWVENEPAEDGPRELASLGLLPVLRLAPQLGRIADPSPLVTLATYRLLEAVVHRHLPVEGVREWMEIWRSLRFPDSFLNAVEAGCAGKLRLFDSHRPFFQSADIPLEGKPAEPLKSVGYLVPEASTGTNVSHFSHPGEAEHAFCPACCARGLVQLPCFAMAGGAGIKPGINGVPPTYVLPRGGSLFHTLMLSYVLPQHRPALADRPDPGPLWEQDGLVKAREERETTGFIESLTWPPRRVRLFPGPGGECSRCGQSARTLVRRIVFGQGRSRKKELPLWRDPWASYALKKTAGADQPELVPVRPSEQRDLWRDFPSLFLEQPDGTGERPHILDQLAYLSGTFRELRDLNVTHEVFGLRTDMKAKVFEWRQDCFEFPLALLGDPAAPRAIRSALGYADWADRSLLAGLKLLFADAGPLQEYASTLREGKPGKPPMVAVNSNDPVIHGTRRDYWQRLEGRFRRALQDPRLADQEEEAGLVHWGREWRDECAAVASEVLDLALRSYDGDRDAVLRQVTARSVFRGILRAWKGDEE